MSAAKKHVCMRCEEEFDCPHGAGSECAAGSHVLPTIVGPIGMDQHCPVDPSWDWIRAYGKRREDAAKSDLFAALEALTKSVVYEGQQGDGISDEQVPPYEAALAALAKARGDL